MPGEESAISVGVWTVSVVLSVVFAGSGLAELEMSRDALTASGQTGIAVHPLPVVRVRAACGLLAAVRLIAPWSTGFARALTPAAGGALMIVMVGAAYAHAGCASRVRSP